MPRTRRDSGSGYVSSGTHLAESSQFLRSRSLAVLVRLVSVCRVFECHGHGQLHALLSACGAICPCERRNHFEDECLRNRSVGRTALEALPRLEDSRTMDAALKIHSHYKLRGPTAIYPLSAHLRTRKNNHLLTWRNNEPTFRPNIS